MIEVIHKKKVYLVPESWDELSPAQFLAIIQVVRAAGEPLKGRLSILRALLGMSWWRFRMLSAERVAQMLYLAEWVDTDTNLTRQLVEVIYAGEKLYGPRDGYSNIRTAEFHFADTFYSAWKASGEEIDLYRFVAVLYRRGKKGYDMAKDPDGDERVDFNPNEVEYYANRLLRMSAKHLDPAIAYGAALCYESWRMEFEKMHPRIFTKKNQRRAARYGWIPVFRGIASNGTYGNFDAVEQMYLGTMMMELEMLKDDEEELKRKHPELFKKK